MVASQTEHEAELRVGLISGESVELDGGLEQLSQFWLRVQSLLESIWLLSVELSSSSLVIRYSHPTDEVPPCGGHRCLNPRKDIRI